MFHIAFIAHNTGHGSWGRSNDSPEDALKEARKHYRDTFRSKSTMAYVLTFPEGTEVTINDLSHGWGATQRPVALSLTHNMPADFLAEIEREVQA
jgi:hypothetical protein